MTKYTRGRKPKAEEQLDSKFGSLVRQHYQRKNISNQLLANETLLDPTLISKMLKGQRTNRSNVLAVISGLTKLGVLDTLEEANALLTAVPGQAGLDQRLPEEANLIKTLAKTSTPTISSSYLPATRSNLPHLPNRLIGREREVKEIKALLNQEQTRLVTICGVGGVGKTCLALEVANALSSHFADGVYFFPLERVTESLSLIVTLNATLQVSETSGQTPLASLIKFLQTKNLLLILDNFEQLINHATILAEILGATSKLKILVTSREGLRLSFEWQYPLNSLDLPETKNRDYQNLLDYPVVNLFAERARRVKPDFSLNIHNIASVVDICRRLDGLPLAIELAAAYIRLFEVESLANRLNLKFLSGGVRDLPQRHQSLIATIAWSYELLSPAERTVFLCLGMFASASLEALEAVCAGHLKADLEQTCLSLLDKSLVKVETGRYVMLQTIREYALEQLQNNAKQTEWYNHFEAYFENLAKKYNEQLKKDNSSTILGLVDLEYNNLKTVLNRCIQLGEVDRAYQLCEALNEYWYLKESFWSEGRDYCEQTFKLVTDKAQKAELLVLIADLALLQGDYTLAEDQAKASFAIWSELSDLRGLKTSLITLGNLATARSNFQSAKNYHAQSLKICQDTDDQPGIAVNLNNLALIAHQEGQYQLAQQYLEDSLSIAKAINRIRTISVSLSYLARLHYAQGQLALAQSYNEQVLALEQELDNKRGIAIALGDLGIVTYQQGDYRLAQEYFKESLTIRRAYGIKTGIAASLNGLGDIAYSQAEYQLAQFYYEEALKLYQEDGLKRGSLKSLLGLAKTRLSQQDRLQVAYLCGAIANLVKDMKIVLNPLEAKTYHELEEGCHQLGEDRFKEVFTQGEQMDLQLHVKQIFQNPDRQAYPPIVGSMDLGENKQGTEKEKRLRLS